MSLSDTESERSLQWKEIVYKGAEARERAGCPGSCRAGEGGGGGGREAGRVLSPGVWLRSSEHSHCQSQVRAHKAEDE